MVKISLEELKSRIEDYYDVDDICWMLDITVFDLLDRFEDYLLAARHKFDNLENTEEEEDN